MKILHISQGYKGSAIYKNLFSHLSEKGVKNIVYVPQFEDIGEEQKSNIYVSENKYSRIQRFVFFGKQNQSLKEIEERIDLSEIDLIHAHNTFSGGYVAYLLNKKYHIPYLVSVRNTDVNTFYKYMIHLRPIGFKILKDAKKIIFISPSYKNKVLNQWFNSNKRPEYHQKSTVIANGLDSIFEENPVIKKDLPSSNNIKLIYYGEISKNKNLPTTIQACIKLINEGYRVNFDIVGNVKSQSFYKLFEQYDFIKFTSYCSKEDLLQFIRKADIFIMPSKHETFGLVYTEALSQGLPIIYTRSQGYDGFFEQGEVGYAVEYKDHNAIVNSIKAIYADYQNISQRCLQGYKKFSWNKLSEQYFQTYQTILDNNNQ